MTQLKFSNRRPFIIMNDIVMLLNSTNSLDFSYPKKMVSSQNNNNNNNKKKISVEK